MSDQQVIVTGFAPDSELDIPVSCETNVAEVDQKDSIPQYTIQGVLHFLQTEWARLETQRSDWETDRAELKAKIAFLEGERRGQENLKQDLIMRIKMLEYALKQERVKFHQYKASISNVGPQAAGKRAEENHAQSWCEEPSKPVPKQLDSVDKLAMYTKQAVESNSKWQESRIRLKTFLKEVGCTDTLLTLRQARILRLLKSTPEWRNALADVEVKSPTKKILTKPWSVSDERAKSALLEMDAAIGGSRAADITYSDEPTEPDTTAQPHELCETTHVNRFRRTGGSSSISLNEKQQKLNYGIDGNSNFRLSSAANAVSSFIDALTSDESADDPKGTDNNEALVNKNILGLIDALGADSEEDSIVATPRLNNVTVVEASQRLGSDHFCVTSRVCPSDLNTRTDELSTKTDLTKDHLPSDGLVLGGLASLTVANETEFFTESDFFDQNPQMRTNDDWNSGRSPSDQSLSGADLSKREVINQPLTLDYTLRGHFDSIRSIAFHPTDRALFTASEDGCVMLWYLGKPSSSQNASGCQTRQPSRVAFPHSTDELEPVYVYRGHDGPVLCVATPSSPTVSYQSSVAYSGGLDGTVRSWHLPSVCRDSGISDLYAPYEPISTVGTVFRGSTAAVWSVAVHPSYSILTAAHADGTIEFWASDDISIATKSEPLRTVQLNQLLTSTKTPVGRPTSLQYLVSRPDSLTASQCVIGTTTGCLVLLDVLTGQLVGHCEPDMSSTMTHPSDLGCNGLAVQPTLSLIVGAHEDKRIRFYDIGRMSTDHSLIGNVQIMENMHAHTDSVTCVAIESQGLYVLTGSHDASVRLWDLPSRSCVQEMTNHRVKNNESVLAVALHPRLPLAASAGADGVCKVYGTNLLFPTTVY